MVKTERLQLPTVQSIAVDGADESIFGSQTDGVQVVKIQKNALLIEFDLPSLQNATVFPYLAHKRNATETTALKLAETDKYNAVAVFDETQNQYHTYLVLKTACTQLSAQEYSVVYETGKTAYLTNSVNLYKFPYLCELLTAARLERGAEIVLLGEIGELDHEYYFIAYKTANGETKTGYIPQSYATDFNASPSQMQENGYGNAENNDDAVWRMTYLLLGLAAIAILVDFLILHKRNRD